MTIKDNDLEKVFQNMIIQTGNYNANSDLFINDDIILKIYRYDYEQNLEIVRKILTRKNELEKVKELVLPKELIIYNGHTVGFSMPYIKGLTLQEITDNNLYDDNTMKLIFKKTLSVIDSFKNLPFDFSIGDMHEKNVIVDDNLDIHIIDCDSFIIDNKKISEKANYRIGKFANHYFNNNILKEDISFDYFNLLSIILNYAFKSIIIDTGNPINFIKDDKQFKSLSNIYNRIDDIKNFSLTENDIEEIFKFKNDLVYVPEDDSELKELLKKIRLTSNKK